MSVPEVWYYADRGGQTGPLSLEELKETLATTPDARSVLVWCEDFRDWKKAGDVPELKKQTAIPSPPLTGAIEKSRQQAFWPLKRSNTRVWFFWGAMLGAAMAASRLRSWGDDAVLSNVIELVTQTLGFGAFGALAAAIRNWAGRGT